MTDDTKTTDKAGFADFADMFSETLRFRTYYGAMYASDPGDGTIIFNVQGKNAAISAKDVPTLAKWVSKNSSHRQYVIDEVRE